MERLPCLQSRAAHVAAWLALYSATLGVVLAPSTGCSPVRNTSPAQKAKQTLETLSEAEEKRAVEIYQRVREISKKIEELTKVIFPRSKETQHEINQLVDELQAIEDVPENAKILEVKQYIRILIDATHDTLQLDESLKPLPRKILPPEVFEKEKPAGGRFA